MKTNAIIRIILYSLAILVLLGILLGGLGFSLYGFNHEVYSGTSEEGPLAFDGSSVTGSVNADSVRRIKINWAAGSITIRPDENGKGITFTETGNDREKYHMAYTLRDGTLEIDFSKDSVTFPSFGFTSEISKDLTILVPAGWVCQELELDVAATNVEIRDLTIQEVDFDGASGTCLFENCQVTQLELDTASGDIQFSGTLETLDFDAASASFTGILTNVPHSIDMDSASGDLELVLPAVAGFTASIDGLSCDFTSDFPVTTVDGRYVCGDGSCRISVDGMSCDVSIRKGN